VEQRKCGILLVEHDMGLVLGICRDIYVMDFGRLLFSGAPTEVQQSTVVQAAYLGVAEDVAEDVAEELRGS
jgi:ABC-type branched-subunit amino acid transport system ATPase component